MAHHSGLDVHDLAPIIQAIAGIFVLIILATGVLTDKLLELPLLLIIILSIFIIIIGIIFTYFRWVGLLRKA